MQQFRVLSREEEPVNFRPVPGMEEEWASFEEPRRSRLWMWLGIIPLSVSIALCLVTTGILMMEA